MTETTTTDQDDETMATGCSRGLRYRALADMRAGTAGPVEWRQVAPGVWEGTADLVGDGWSVEGYELAAEFCPSAVPLATDLYDADPARWLVRGWYPTCGTGTARYRGPDWWVRVHTLAEARALCAAYLTAERARIGGPPPEAPTIHDNYRADEWSHLTGPEPSAT